MAALAGGGRRAPTRLTLPITVGGVLFNVPPASIRVSMQRRPGALERLDLAFLWPSLEPPDPKARPRPERSHSADRPACSSPSSVQTVAMAPHERVRMIYPRYLGDTQYDGPDGLKDDPRSGRHAATPTRTCSSIRRQPELRGALLASERSRHAAACASTERRFDQADVSVRFPSEWLTEWRACGMHSLGKLLGNAKAPAA